MIGQLDNAEVARHAHVIDHRPAKCCHYSAGINRCLGNLLHAMNMTCETCSDNAFGLVFGKQLPQYNSNAAFARCRTALFGIRTVEHQQANSVSRCQCTKSCQVSAAVINRCEINLEVTRVNNHALRSVQRNRVREWHRVCNGNELNIKWPNATALVIDNRNQFGFAQQPGLFDSVASEPKCDRRTINRK